MPPVCVGGGVSPGADGAPRWIPRHHQDPHCQQRHRRRQVHPRHQEVELRELPQRAGRQGERNESYFEIASVKI
jgi:hypothetical protein